MGQPHGHSRGCPGEPVCSGTQRRDMPWSSLCAGCGTGPSPWSRDHRAVKANGTPQKKPRHRWPGGTLCLLGTTPSAPAAGLCVFPRLGSPWSIPAPKGWGSPSPASAHGLWAGRAGRGVLAPAPLGPPHGRLQPHITAARLPDTYSHLKSCPTVS